MKAFVRTGRLATRARDAALCGLPVTDVALAFILCLLAVLSAATDHPAEGSLIITVPTAIGLTLPLAWRSRAPLTSVAALVAAGEVQSLLAEHVPGSIWSLAAYLVAAYSVAAKAPEGRAAVGGALVVGGLWLQEWHSHGTDYLFMIIVFGGAWLVGRAVRQWTSRAASAERNQDERAHAAVGAERARIARELHDVVAHAVSVIAIQADAADAALDRDPDLARAPLRAIKSSSREALDEMRRLLLLLRMDDETASASPLAPQPGLGQLDYLLDAVRGAGLPVTLRTQGTAKRLSPGLDLSAYRIIQEALTNVLKHAGAVATCVTIRYSADSIELEVDNQRPPYSLTGHPPGRNTVPGAEGGTGKGLVGIRERTMIMGGVLHAGPNSDGGFVIRVHLPVRETAQEIAL